MTRKNDRRYLFFFTGLVLNTVNALVGTFAVNPLLEATLGVTVYGPVAYLVGLGIILWTVYLWIESGFVSLRLGIVLPIAAFFGWTWWGAPTVFAAIMAAQSVLYFKIPFLLDGLRRQ